jgi:murein DD-endopeptidase MepM/ murein hydrolase activator NlpD
MTSPWSPFAWPAVLAVALASATATGPFGAGAGATRAPTAAPQVASSVATPTHRWSWPLPPTPSVARRFAAPTTAYGRGHRGVDLRPAAAGPVTVLSVADGVVTHVGVVAGRGTLTIAHSGGLRSTYEPVEAVVAAGQEVRRGDVVGVLSGPSHCDPAATCLHLGAVHDGRYVDPLRFIRGSGPVVLLPLG